MAGFLLAQGSGWQASADYIAEGDVPTIYGLEAVVANILNIIIGLAGVVLLLMLIGGGFGYITSGGDKEKAAKAKNTLTYAILGLQKMKLAATIPSNDGDDGILKNGRVENPLLPMGLQPLAEETPSTLGHILSTRLTNGVIGLAIVLCLFAITQLFSSLFGINLLEFTIPRL